LGEAQKHRAPREGPYEGLLDAVHLRSVPQHLPQLVCWFAEKYGVCAVLSNPAHEQESWEEEGGNR